MTLLPSKQRAAGSSPAVPVTRSSYYQRFGPFSAVKETVAQTLLISDLFRIPISETLLVLNTRPPAAQFPVDTGLIFPLPDRHCYPSEYMLATDDVVS
ncbi:hypothetical protein QUA74_14250 [Microcoleus sp. LAD1_D3]|uniref:hypothetical protein n=1 Tax=Microcoleus sp. LAD1_D3 TaxID=2819365 RepID=UPI002FD06DC0